jgi:predicted porin
MKKSLFAIAAVTAFAGAAQAQSSVTVYGIIDMGLNGGHQKGSTGATRAAQTPFNNTGMQFGQNAETTSRLGFRGTEDLGGGKSAFFTLETALTPDGNNMFGTGGTANRVSIVGLANKGMGRMAIGTNYTPLFSNTAATSPGQLNNIMGDIIYGAQTANGITGFGTTASAPALAANNANSGTDVGFTVRTANMLRIDTDPVAGFVGQAFYSMDNTTDAQTGTTTATNRTGGKNDRNGWGLGTTYTFKQLLVAANYQSLVATNPYAAATNGSAVAPVTASVPATGTPAIFGSSVNTGVNMKDNQWFAGATYNFGILKAYAQYINRKATSQRDATQYATRTGQQIGVRGNWTPTIESWASIGTGKYMTYGSTAPTVNFNGYQVGTNYILSKRTNLYGIYGATNTGTSSAGTYFNGAQYAVGVRHTF